MSDERINKILSACWQNLSPEHKGVYEHLVKERKYLEDIRGIREHNKNGTNKKAHVDVAMEMDAFGSKLNRAVKKKVRQPPPSMFDTQYTAQINSLFN